MYLEQKSALVYSEDIGTGEMVRWVKRPLCENEELG